MCHKYISPDKKRDKDGLLQSNGNTICVLDPERESAPPRPKR